MEYCFPELLFVDRLAVIHRTVVLSKTIRVTMYGDDCVRVNQRAKVTQARSCRSDLVWIASNHDPQPNLRMRRLHDLVLQVILVAVCVMILEQIPLIPCR